MKKNARLTGDNLANALAEMFHEGGGCPIGAFFEINLGEEFSECKMQAVRYAPEKAITKQKTAKE